MTVEYTVAKEYSNIWILQQFNVLRDAPIPTQRAGLDIGDNGAGLFTSVCIRYTVHYILSF